MTDLDDLPPPKNVLKFVGVEPINLPSFTFLIGDPGPCFAFAERLSAQSEYVYTEDFLAPVYDAVQALYELSPLTTHAQIADNHANDVNAIRGALPNLDLVNRLMKRAEDLLSFHPYQIVVRDCQGFSVPVNAKTKDCIIVHLGQNKIFRGVNPNTSRFILPPGADMIKELRAFCLHN